MTPGRVLFAWGKVLTGRIPLLSIEITRECPLRCPGCYAYGDMHLGGLVTLNQLNDLRGEALVERVIDLVKYHQPIHVSIVGGEPLIRHRELGRILPVLSQIGVFTLVVTSGVIPIPQEWMAIKQLRVAVSVDGLPEHHNRRRAPATYERILQNIGGRHVNIHLVVTGPMMKRPGYLEEYLNFWTARTEVDRIWMSVYTPQIGEQSEEILTPAERQELVRQIPELVRRFPALWINEGMAQAFADPPANPRECLFSRMSVNYSADLKTRVEPCVFGGNPDCRQCGCAISAGLHWLGQLKLGPLKVSHAVRASMGLGTFVGSFRPGSMENRRWNATPHREEGAELAQIKR